MQRKSLRLFALISLVIVQGMTAFAIGQEQPATPAEPTSTAESNVESENRDGFGATQRSEDGVKASPNQTPVDNSLIASVADCDLHVIGIYMPKESSKDDRVYVEIKKTERPMVVTLAAYGSTQWNLKIEPDAPLKLIVVAGYFEQELANPPPNVPIIYRTYFSANDREKMKELTFAQKDAREYFWASSWHTKEGRDLKKKLKDLTGLDVKTFQSTYEGSTFVIDGIRGDVKTLEADELNQGHSNLVSRIVDEWRSNPTKYEVRTTQDGRSGALKKMDRLQQLRRLLVSTEAELSDLLQKTDPQPQRIEVVKSRMEALEDEITKVRAIYQESQTVPVAATPQTPEESTGESITADNATSITLLLRKHLEEKLQKWEQDYHDAERGVNDATTLYREGVAANDSDVKREKKRKRLQIHVERSFNALSLVQECRMQLASLDLQLLQAKQQRRQTLADKIINRRVDDLISGQDLSWTTSETMKNKPGKDMPKADERAAPTTLPLY